MGSTFTVVVIGLAAVLGCAAFGLALGLRTPSPRPAARRPAPPRGGARRR